MRRTRQRALITSLHRSPGNPEAAAGPHASSCSKPFGGPLPRRSTPQGLGVDLVAGTLEGCEWNSVERSPPRTHGLDMLRYNHPLVSESTSKKRCTLRYLHGTRVILTELQSNFYCKSSDVKKPARSCKLEIWTAKLFKYDQTSNCALTPCDVGTRCTSYIRTVCESNFVRSAAVFGYLLEISLGELHRVTCLP